MDILHKLIIGQKHVAFKDNSIFENESYLEIARLFKFKENMLYEFRQFLSHVISSDAKIVSFKNSFYELLYKL